MRLAWPIMVLALLGLQLLAFRQIDARFDSIDAKLDQIDGHIDRIEALTAEILQWVQRLEQQGPRP